MKALILAAGFGTRLRPFSRILPKPLFSFCEKPLLDINIDYLIAAGCDGIMINSHHLHDKLTAHIVQNRYLVPVVIRHEPEILGTGGAIKNAADFWDDRPFVVINGDILTDLDLKAVYYFHTKAACHPATLVLHDFPRFNTVLMDQDGFIRGFDSPDTAFRTAGEKRSAFMAGLKERLSYQKMAFTGIQILNPAVLDFIPDKGYFSSIDMYRKMIAAGAAVRAFTAKKIYWTDIGTPARYRQAAFDYMAPRAFRQAFGTHDGCTVHRKRLAGDGSDRKWYRLSADNQTVIMVDHGLSRAQNGQEVDAFIAIGRHLKRKKVAVPKIYLHDRLAGLVFMEDLGDVHLQSAITENKSSDAISALYEKVIRRLVRLWVAGAKAFDLAWPWQSSFYDRQVIIEKECRYFVDAFLNGYLEMAVDFNTLQSEFICLAKKALEFAVMGFMHRDLQSKNIMLKGSAIYFIDFQGGRMGPIQYDLASLLIDPYAGLSLKMQSQLFDYCVHALTPVIDINKEEFYQGYKYLSITRNLQILGAFAYLSRVKGKIQFEDYIFPALKTLAKGFCSCPEKEFPNLKALIAKTVEMVK
jgi:NDP-sugar pyrophosphorylase family protein/tRNA A-37 threonylcarbamoyl transferase component Bud32